MFNSPSELRAAIVPHPLIVTPDTTVREAIALMSGVRSFCTPTKSGEWQLNKLHLEARASCVLVVETSNLVGILTERDVVRLMAQQTGWQDLAIAQVMVKPVISLCESNLTNIFTAINLLQQYQIRHLPILDKQAGLVGLVTHETLHHTSCLVELLQLRLVSEVMNTEVICATSNSTMLTIAQLMAQHRVSCVIIVETIDSQTVTRQLPLGMITERDLVQFQALGLNLESCLAKEVMSTPIWHVYPEDSLLVVHQLMERHLLRRLAVTNKQGELLGIVTQTSLLHALNPLELYKLATGLKAKVVLLEAEKLHLMERRTLELEEQVKIRTQQLELKSKQERLMGEVAIFIRSSLSLQIILETTVTQVRQLLGCERVNIWQFDGDWQTVAVAESTDSSLSLVGMRLTDECFQQGRIEIYRQGRIRVVQDIFTTEMSDCHRDMLIRLQTRSKILVPLFCGDELWGLLNATESQYPREWRAEDVELLRIVSVHLNLAIQQSLTYEQLQTQLVERQQAEVRLRDSEERYATLAAVVPVGIFRTDIQGNSIYVNQKCSEMLGISPEATIGQGWLAAIHPDDRAKVLAETIRSREENRPFQMEYRICRPDGTVIWVLGQAVPEQDAEGQIVGYVGTITDISDRKQAEQQIHRLNQNLEFKVTERTTELTQKEAQLKIVSERLALSLKSGGMGCWEWNFLTDTAFWDERIYELYGIPKQADYPINYDNWVKILHPDDRKPVETLVNQTLFGNAEYNTEFRVIHPDGSIHFIRAYGMVVRDHQGNPEKMIGVNFEITDRKQAEEALLRSAEREKLLREITLKIRQSLNLQTIFDTACQEIRQVIQAERVGIFRFYPHSRFDEGVFVAESVAEGVSSVLATQVHDHCFGENYSSLYAKGDYFAVDDIYTKGLTDCHIDILAKFAVRASLVMPLICSDQLWGLLCVHQCRTSRHWQQSEINFTQQLANQLAIAIQQADLYEQVQLELSERRQAEAKIALELRRQQTLGMIVKQIRESLDLGEILTTVTHLVREVMQCDRVIVFRLFPDGRSKIVEEAVSPEFPALKDHRWEDEVWSQEILDCYLQGKPRIVPDVMNDLWTHCLVEYCNEGKIQSKIVAPILQEVQAGEHHRWVAFQETNKLWGVLVVHACREKRVWQESAAELLQQIANWLALAIKQANLFAHLQQQLIEKQQAEAKLTETNQQLAISNQELARATRLKDEFLANMSHELRTPLNAILGMTEGLQEEIFGSVNPQQLKALQTVERSGNHLLELINDILDVAKIEAGKLELEYMPTSLVDLCQSSLTFIKQQALQKRITVNLKLPPNLPSLLIDQRRMRQVLINLLNNAVKFTPEGGSISLEVSPKQQNLVRISVSDTGIGIGPENLNKLFQPFIQIDSALNRKYSGTGLGLALVKRIVELHGGSVGLTSELGVGSCFTIELPFDTPQV